MKLRKFNESKSVDEKKEIIRDAFYNITDTYSLNVSLEIDPFLPIESQIKNSPSYNKLLYDVNIFLHPKKNKHIKEYICHENVKDFEDHINFINDLSTKCSQSLAYLKQDFDLINISLNNDSIRIKLKDKINI